MGRQSALRASWCGDGGGGGEYRDGDQRTHQGSRKYVPGVAGDGGRRYAYKEYGGGRPLKRGIGCDAPGEQAASTDPRVETMTKHSVLVVGSRVAALSALALAVGCVNEADPNAALPAPVEEFGGTPAPAETAATGGREVVAPAADGVAPAADPAGQTLAGGSTGLPTEVAPNPAPLDIATFLPVPVGPRLALDRIPGSVTFPAGHWGPGGGAVGLAGTFAGAVDAATALSTECGAMITADPQQTLEIDEPTRAVIELTRLSGPAWIVVQTRAGVRCVRGTPEELPRLEPLLVRGTAKIWVGTDPGAEPVQFEGRMAQALPSIPTATCDRSQLVTVDAAFTSTAVTGQVEAVRGFESAFASEHGGGFFGTTGGPCLFVTEPTRLTVTASGTGFDPVVGVQLYDGSETRVNDDAGATEAGRLTLDLQPGLHTLHVGSAAIGGVGAFAGTVSRAAVPTELTSAPTDCIDLAAGSAVRLKVGTTALGPCADATSAACTGTLPAEPSICVNLAEGATLGATVESAVFDASLAIAVGDTAVFVADGGSWPQPEAMVALGGGRYELRVGSQDEGAGEFTLALEAW